MTKIIKKIIINRSLAKYYRARIIPSSINKEISISPGNKSIRSTNKINNTVTHKINNLNINNNELNINTNFNINNQSKSRKSSSSLVDEIKNINNIR